MVVNCDEIGERAADVDAYPVSGFSIAHDRIRLSECRQTQSGHTCSWTNAARLRYARTQLSPVQTKGTEYLDPWERKMKTIWRLIDSIGRDRWYLYALIFPVGMFAVLSATMAGLRSCVPENTQIQIIGILLLLLGTLYGGVLIFCAVAAMLRSVWHDPDKYTGVPCMQDPDENSRAEAQAMAILGMALAVPGFVWSGSEIQIHSFSNEFLESSVLLQLQLTSLVFAALFYIATINSIRVVLMQSSTTFSDVKRGPVFGMVMVMGYSAFASPDCCINRGMLL